MIPRVLNWRTLLVAWAEDQIGKPFVWGETDCAALSRNALRVMFGAEAFNGLPFWTTRQEAFNVLRVYGKPEELLSTLDPSPATVNWVRAGDVLVMKEEEERIGRRSLFVCYDGRHGLMSTREGVKKVDLFRAQLESVKAYSIWSLPQRAIG